MPGTTDKGLLLAIDAGGTAVKATVFDPVRGRIATVSRPVPLTHPAPGLSERDPEELWATTVTCIREALAEPDGKVLAVGLTAHGNGAYLVDAAGRPTRSAVMAADTRAAAQVRRWISDGLAEQLQGRSWSGLWAGQPGPILSLLTHTEPDSLKATHALLWCKDYLWARLTGNIETELTTAAASGLYDCTAWAETSGAQPLTVSEPAIEAFGLQGWRHLLSTPIAPTTVHKLTAEASEATGLPAGTPVVAGVVDNTAVQHGSGVFDGSVICIGAGTWSINQLLVPAAQAAAQAAAVRPHAATIALNSTALLCEASPTSASNLSWAINQAIRGHRIGDDMISDDVYRAQLNRETRRPRRADDPMYLPFIDGSRDEAAARGAWLGLSSATNDDDLLGAVIEGICFEHRRHINRLQATLPTRLPVRLSGGATKSPAWCQRFADTLGVPIHTSPITELGSVCAGAMAGVEVGAFADVPAGVAALNPEWHTYEPDPAGRDFADVRYHRYARLAEAIGRMRWEEP